MPALKDITKNPVPIRINGVNFELRVKRAKVMGVVGYSVYIVPAGAASLREGRRVLGAASPDLDVDRAIKRIAESRNIKIERPIW